MSSYNTILFQMLSPESVVSSSLAFSVSVYAWTTQRSSRYYLYCESKRHVKFMKEQKVTLCGL